MDRRICSQDLKYRFLSRIVAVMDIICAMATMIFHGYTIFAQEIHGKSKIMLVPLSPVGLGLFGSIMVIAWIGIISCNILQLCVGLSLYYATSQQADAAKSLGSSRLWLKTSFFISILVVSKLVIIYFLSQLGTQVTISLTLSLIELGARIAGLFILATFHHELTLVFPDITRIYYDTHVTESSSPKRNMVGDAVWF